MSAIFTRFLALSSPRGQRWQWRQTLPFAQPWGFQNHAQGLHLPSPCTAEPIEGSASGEEGEGPPISWRSLMISMLSGSSASAVSTRAGAFTTSRHMAAFPAGSVTTCTPDLARLRTSVCTAWCGLQWVSGARMLTSGFASGSWMCPRLAFWWARCPPPMLRYCKSVATVTTGTAGCGCRIRFMSWLSGGSSDAGSLLAALMVVTFWGSRQACSIGSTGFARPRSASILARRRVRSASSEQRWQCWQDVPFLQPPRFQNQAHGLQAWAAWRAEPTEGRMRMASSHTSSFVAKVRRFSSTADGCANFARAMVAPSMKLCKRSKSQSGQRSSRVERSCSCVSLATGDGGGGSAPGASCPAGPGAGSSASHSSLLSL
mmetsp:Transcript_2405/g.5411  ORF Transcript_2405/g.5411 Transcript_2405/m.5411 type:complete len:374 (+) Transcript_2405:364-1485(+)